MTATAAQKPENPYAKVYAGFLEQTKNHQLTVVHADGLYRQLRMHDPEMGSMWSWGITTWPWHLATFGDIGSGYMFSREQDMLEFFSSAGRSDGYYSDGAPSIDFRYWAEKLVGTGNYDRVRRYSHELFVQMVTAHLEEDEELGLEAQAEYEKIIAVAQRLCGRNGIAYADYLCWQRTGLLLLDLDIDPDDSEETALFGLGIPEQSPAERRNELIYEARDLVEEANEAAHEWVREHEAIFGTDTWEWNLNDFNVHFILACYALDMTVRCWREFCTTQQKAG